MTELIAVIIFFACIYFIVRKAIKRRRVDIFQRINLMDNWIDWIDCSNPECKARFNLEKFPYFDNTSSFATFCADGDAFFIVVKGSPMIFCKKCLKEMRNKELAIRPLVRISETEKPLFGAISTLRAPHHNRLSGIQ